MNHVPYMLLEYYGIESTSEVLIDINYKDLISKDRFRTYFNENSVVIILWGLVK